MERLKVNEKHTEAGAESGSPAYVPSLQTTEGQPPPIAANGGLSYMSLDQNGDAGTAAATEAAVNLIAEEAPYRSIAAALQDTAEELGADMIVTGAFGHSMIYDFVIGAVTSDLLSSMKLPVLFSN